MNITCYTSKSHNDYYCYNGVFYDEFSRPVDASRVGKKYEVFSCGASDMYYHFYCARGKPFKFLNTGIIPNLLTTKQYFDKYVDEHDMQLFEDLNGRYILRLDTKFYMVSMAGGRSEYGTHLLSDTFTIKNEVQIKDICMLSNTITTTSGIKLKTPGGKKLENIVLDGKLNFDIDRTAITIQLMKVRIK